MSRSPYDRWHRPEGYHKSIAAGVPSRLSKGALARLNQHFADKQEAEFVRELEARRPKPLRLPSRSASTTIRVASYEDLPSAFRPLGSGFYRLGHSIWEMRPDSDEGYKLVRKHEERAVDMREQPRTASKKGPQPGDTALWRTAQGIQPVVILALPSGSGLSSIMDMVGGLFKAPSQELFLDDRPIELDEECLEDEEECYDDVDMGDDMLMSPMSGYVELDLPSIMGDEVEFEPVDEGDLEELEEDEDEEAEYEKDEGDDEEDEDEDFESIIEILEGFGLDDEEDEDEDEGHDRKGQLIFTAEFNRREAARSIGPGDLLDMLRGNSQFAIISGNTGSTRSTQKKQTKTLLEDIKDFEDESGGPKYSDSQIYTVRGRWGIPSEKLERKKEEEFSSGARSKDKWFQLSEEPFPGGAFEREKSFLIEGMDFADAIKLSKKHKQEAFIFKSADGVVGMYYTKVPEGSEPYVQLAAEGGTVLLGEESTEIKPKRDPKPSGSLHPEDVGKYRREFDLIDPRTNAPVIPDLANISPAGFAGRETDFYLTTDSEGVPGFEVVDDEGPYGSPRYYYKGRELRPVGSEPRFFKDDDWLEPGRFSRRPETDLWSSGRNMSFGIKFDFDKNHPWDPNSGEPYSANEAINAYGGEALVGPSAPARMPKRKLKKQEDYLKSGPKTRIERFPRGPLAPSMTEFDEDVEDPLSGIYDPILDQPD